MKLLLFYASLNNELRTFRHSLQSKWRVCANKITSIVIIKRDARRETRINMHKPQWSLFVASNYRISTIDRRILLFYKYVRARRR